ncbi:hypothetical protein ScPMuIL_001256 [Solemya velum]
MDGIVTHGSSGGSSVVIGGFKSNLSRDTLQYYFENTHRNGGGEIKEIVVDRERALAYITFVDSDAADRVCSRPHQLENCSLLVSKRTTLGRSGDDANASNRYLDVDNWNTKPNRMNNSDNDSMIGISSTHSGMNNSPRRPTMEPWDQQIPMDTNTACPDTYHRTYNRASPEVPRDIVVRNLDQHKLRFVMRKDQRKNPIETQLRKLGFEIQWPLRDSDKCLVLEYRPSVSSEQVSLTVSETATQTLNDFFDVIFVEKFTVRPEIWTLFLEGVQSLDVTNGDYLEVYVEFKTLVISGYKKFAMSVADQIRRVLHDTESKFSTALDRVKDVYTHLKLYELKVLSANDYPKKLMGRYRGLRVVIDLATLEVIFEGHSTDVRLAQKDLNGILSNITKFPLSPKLSASEIDLLRRQPVVDYIGQQLSRRQLCCIWDVINEDVYIYQMSLSECYEAANIISKSIVRVVIPVDKRDESVLVSRNWTVKCQDIEAQLGGRVKIITDTHCQGLCLVSTDDISQRVESMIKDFIRCSSPQVERMQVDPFIMKFLRVHCSKDLVKLASDLKQTNVVIEHDDNEFRLQGTDEFVRNGAEKVRNLIGSIRQRKHILKDQAMKKYMKSTKGRDYISAVEHANACLIKIIDGEPKGQVSGHSNTRHVQRCVTCTTSAGQKISVFRGDVMEIQTEALVNAANNYLEHIGGLARAVVERGGDSIQRECDDFIKKNGCLFDGEIFCSNPGTLPFRVIIHAVGPVWNEGKDNEKLKLNAVILKCLKECSRCGFRSIAIPALSAGIFGFPRDLATCIIVEAVEDFLNNGRDNVVQEVVFFDKDGGIVRYFGDALKATFRGQCVEDQRAGSSPMMSRAASSPFGSMKVNIIQGELAKEKVDTLVCVTSSGLKLDSGVLSKSVLDMGGKKLQDDCHRKYPNGVKPGEVAVTTGGHLYCQHVFWGTLPAWDGGSGNSSKSLGKFLYKCLTEAEKMRARSIAIPALGTGKLGYPRDIVARIMLDTASDFSKTNPSSLREIWIVLYKLDIPTIKAFHHEEQKWRDGHRHKSNRHTEATDKKAASDNGSRPVTGTRNTFSFGSMCLTVKEGDISAETSDGIVNGLTKEADFSKGALSAILLKKGGQPLQRDCDSKKSDIQRTGIITTTGGNLRCRNVIHVILPRPSDGAAWRQVILKCLQRAEDEHMTSLAFPALGTGGLGLSVGNLAHNVFEALEEFSKRPVQYLLDVRIVFYKSRMFPAFMDIINDHMKRTNYQQTRSGSSGPGIGNHASSDMGFIIYARTMSEIDDVIQKIDSTFAQEIIEKIIRDEIIRGLDPAQINKIESLSQNNQVRIDVYPKNGSIKIVGLISDVMYVINDIHDMFREIERQAITTREATFLAAYVSWNYIDITENGQNMKPYEGHVNVQLERAFKDNKNQTTFRDTIGREYIVDFKSMEEYPVVDPTDRVKIIRKDLVQKPPSASIVGDQLPVTWTAMDHKENIKVIKLSPQTTEYQDVEKNFIRCGGPAKVLKIERIQNRALFQQYMTKKRLMELQNSHISQNERTLWHGTSQEATDSINLYGFNRSYCGKNATAYGEGVYFASDASYSCSTTYARPDSRGNQRVYQSKVLTGEYTRGKQGLRVAPYKDAAKHILFDCVVGGGGTPSIFVIFHDTQAYPEYLITFGK